jgi:GDP-mannose transporter
MILIVFLSYLLLTIAVMNKCLTILLNLMIWDQHAKPGGIFCLFICIAGGIVYQQAPMRGEKSPLTVTSEDDAFKSDIACVETELREEEMDLIEKQNSPNNPNKRRV